MASIFSKIIAGTIPAYKVAEDDEFIAFLDIFPQATGHTLVVPKVEIDRIWDLPKEILTKYLLFAKPIAEAIERAIGCERCAISVIGLDVPHAHVHLIPINSATDLHATVNRPKPTDTEFQNTQSRIIQELQKGRQ